MSKIKIVVVNENTLGYIIPEKPNNFNVLSASTLRGSNMSDFGTYPLPKNTRLATSKDFETYRVFENGYRNDKNYEYER